MGKELRKKRTNIDFSKHELTYLESNIGTEYATRIWELRVGKNYMHRFVFINSCGVLTVSGDYGNWVFCREFHPSKDGYVSSGYWCEKLSMNSEQEVSQYDSEATIEEIDELIESGIDEYFGHPEDDDSLENIKDIKSKLEYLKTCTDEEIDYIYHAYYEPGGLNGMIEHEMIPFVKTMKHRLNYVFDAFEEICNRM